MQDLIYLKVGFHPHSEFPFHMPEEGNLREVTQLLWQPTDTHQILRSSLVSYANMLNFGEHGYCNVLHNFGIQCVTRFQLLGAQKSPLLSFVLLFGQQLESH
jgi:hypothetical protein